MANGAARCVAQNGGDCQSHSPKTKKKQQMFVMCSEINSRKDKFQFIPPLSMPNRLCRAQKQNSENDFYFMHVDQIGAVREPTRERT
jgi:hypothetical protein